MKTKITLLLLAMGFASLVCAKSQGRNEADESWGWKTAVVSSLLLTLATNPGHADHMGIEISDSSDVASIKAMFKWNHKSNILKLGDAQLSSYFMLGYSKWQSYTDPTQVGANNVVELVPVFRFDRPRHNWIDYIETSVGLALFSTTKLNDREFGSNFQFSDSLAIGAYLGDDGNWDISFRFQHYSNNSITLPNDGINFYGISLSHQY